MATLQRSGPAFSPFWIRLKSSDICWTRDSDSRSALLLQPRLTRADSARRTPQLDRGSCSAWMLSILHDRQQHTGGIPLLQAAFASCSVIANLNLQRVRADSVRVRASISARSSARSLARSWTLFLVILSRVQIVARMGSTQLRAVTFELRAANEQD